VLDNWERGLGLEGTGARAMEPYFAAAEAILHTEPNHEDTYGGNTHLFLRGASALGWPVARAPRNMRRCVGLNNCALGCPTGAKQSMLVTEVPRALAAGASLLTHARVDHVTWRGSTARGVTGRLLDTDGRPRARFHVDADLVVLAAGARHTPGILKRSRVWSRQVGRGLHTHPNAKCVGIFDQRFDPWAGTHQAFHIHHFLDDGILIGYAAVPPGLLAGAIPGLGAQNAEKMALYNHMLTAATLVDDETEGRVRLGPDLQPIMWQTLDKRDIERIHRGVALTAELLFAAGAREVLLPFSDLHAIRNPGEIRLIHERPRDRGAIELMTVHIMGSARMAHDPERGATDAFGRVFDVPGLYVADASLLPSPIGVNPQETIAALVARNVRRWLESDFRPHGVGRKRAL
jgi:choline dehydrogenase-like flavoprotein